MVVVLCVVTVCGVAVCGGVRLCAACGVCNVQWRVLCDIILYTVT